MTSETVCDITEFISERETCIHENYEGIPEFDVTDANCVRKDGAGMPHLRFHTHIREDELLPLPAQHTMKHHDIHWELERWTLF